MIPARPKRLPDKVSDEVHALIKGFRAELNQMVKQRDRLNNIGLQGVMDGIFGGNQCYPFDTQQGPWTLANSNNYVPLTLNRILLSYTYMTQGLLRRMIDEPVEDAFRGGVAFTSAELDDDDLKKLNTIFKRKQPRFSKIARTQMARVNVNAGYNMANSDLTAIKQTLTWSRLYGGSGLIINTTQDFRSEFNPELITEDTPLSFIPADRWELLLSQINLFDERVPTPFNYYGLDLHRTRVCTVMGPEAPSYIRVRLQGWGMSILEDAIKAVNAYVKFETLLFELLDEAKIDVLGMTGLNANLASEAGTQLVQRRVALANQEKNFQSTLTMDKDDTYDQKQLTFSGLAEIKEGLRTDLCAYLKFPKNKLFGESAGGFGSGKDSLDNYNSQVGNLRETAEPLVLEVGQLRCQQQFGFIPEDLEVEFEPLAVLDGVEQEAVKTSQQKRVTERFSLGLINGQEASQELRKMDLAIVESEVEKGLREPELPLSQNPDEVAGQQQHEQTMAKNKKPAAGGKK